MENGKISWYKYVPKGFVHVWEKAGWVAHPQVLSGIHHGEYATFMEWTGEGEPVCPHIEGSAA